jgi:NAD(P)-dependent dehydrogenase (short-subunit alcohol dehydrogenase family)
MKKNVLITGVNRGLGLSLVKIFLEKDYQVLALYRTMSSDLKELKKSFDNLLLFNVDITNEIEISKAFSDIQEEVDSIDILINSAAIHLENHRPELEKTNFEAIMKTFDVNSVAPLKIIKQFIQLVKQSQEKLIINITSEAGSVDGQTWRKSEFGYCMSKAALNMMSKLLHNRFKKENIKILAIHPGWFSSDMGGPDAPITPLQAATNVVKTILRDWKIEDPIFVDFEGNPLKW